jgi:DNA-binding IclR family transcriptional regulator
MRLVNLTNSNIDRYTFTLVEAGLADSSRENSNYSSTPAPTKTRSYLIHDPKTV